MVIIFAAAGYFLYPSADALKFSGRGSTADDAIIQAAMTLSGSGKLYDVELYDGAPVSPGPGWIIMNSPFVLFNLYWLMTPFYILTAALIMRYFFNLKHETNRALLLTASSVLFWDLLITGNDLIAAGFLFVILTMAAFRFSRSQSGYIPLLLTAAAAGGAATSRIVFIFFPLLLALFIWKFNPRKGILFAAVSITVCLALHLYYYLINDYYLPLHLLIRGNLRTGPYITAAGIAGTAVLVYYLYTKLEYSIKSWIKSVGFSLALPLTLIALGELINLNFNFALWEGANYFMPASPAVIILIAFNLKND